MKKTSKIKIVQNYARALFNAALDADNLTKTQTDINALKQIENISDIGSPLLEHHQQTELIEMLKKKLKLQKTTVNFLNLLAQNRAAGLFSDIAAEFEHLILTDNKIAQVFIETAQMLSKKQEEKLIKGLRIKLKQDVVLKYKLNENILGGLVLRIDSLQIDDSLAHKIKTFNNIMKG